MPSLSSSPDSALKESIRASKAESQLAVPFRPATVFGAIVISSPKGSAVCTGAAAGGVGGGSAAGGGCRGRCGACRRARRRRRRSRRRLGLGVAETQRNRGSRDQRDRGKAERTDEMHSVVSLAV